MLTPEELTGVHPPPGKLLAYVRGSLDQEAAARVRRHAARCSTCGDQLATLLLLRETRILADDPDTPSDL